MSFERLSRAGAVAGVLALLAGGACREDETPVRIGVVVDCVGINRSLQNAELSGAQLPLIERALAGAARGRRTASRRRPWPGAPWSS
jgi:hypothetical protein